MATDENKSKGFVKIFRSFLEWEWHDDPNTVTVFIHCLLLANYKDTKWHGVEVPRGCFISSISSLAQKTGLSERNIRTAIKHLKESGNLTSKSTNKFTLFKVENYDSYQADDGQPDRQATGKRQADDKQPTTSKEIKKERNKEVKNDDDHSGQAADDLESPFEFDEVVQKEFSPEVGQALQRFRSHWTSKKPTAAEEMGWIQVLKSLPDDKQRLGSIQYSSGCNSSGKWYRKIYSDGFENSKPKKIRVDIKPNLPEWYDIVPTDKATPEEVEEVLRLQRSVLQGGMKR